MTRAALSRDRDASCRDQYRDCASAALLSRCRGGLPLSLSVAKGRGFSAEAGGLAFAFMFLFNDPAMVGQGVLTFQRHVVRDRVERQVNLGLDHTSTYAARRQLPITRRG